MRSYDKGPKVNTLFYLNIAILGTNAFLMPVRESLTLEGGKSLQKRLMMLTVVVSVGGQAIFSHYSGRYGGLEALKGCFLISSACCFLVYICLLFIQGWTALFSSIFYLWFTFYNMTSTSTYWAIAGDVLEADNSKIRYSSETAPKVLKETQNTTSEPASISISPMKTSAQMRSTSKSRPKASENTDSVQKSSTRRRSRSQSRTRTGLRCTSGQRQQQLDRSHTHTHASDFAVKEKATNDRNSTNSDTSGIDHSQSDTNMQLASKGPEQYQSTSISKSVDPMKNRIKIFSYLGAAGTLGHLLGSTLSSVFIRAVGSRTCLVALGMFFVLTIMLCNRLKPRGGTTDMTNGITTEEAAVAASAVVSTTHSVPYEKHTEGSLGQSQNSIQRGDRSASPNIRGKRTITRRNRSKKQIGSYQGEHVAEVVSSCETNGRHGDTVYKNNNGNNKEIGNTKIKGISLWANVRDEISEQLSNLSVMWASPVLLNLFLYAMLLSAALGLTSIERTAIAKTSQLSADEYAALLAGFQTIHGILQFSIQFFGGG